MWANPGRKRLLCKQEVWFLSQELLKFSNQNKFVCSNNRQLFLEEKSACLGHDIHADLKFSVAAADSRDSVGYMSRNTEL